MMSWEGLSFRFQSHEAPSPLQSAEPGQTDPGPIVHLGSLSPHVPLGLTPKDPDLFPFAELPAKNSPAASIVQAEINFSCQAPRYQWFFNHPAYGRAVSARRAVAHDERSTRCGRSHLRQESEDYASIRGDAYGSGRTSLSDSGVAAGRPSPW